jgi:hypothetical protein
MDKVEYIFRKFAGKWRLGSVLLEGWLTALIKVVSAEPHTSLGCRCKIGFDPITYHLRMEFDGFFQW